MSELKEVSHSPDDHAARLKRLAHEFNNQLCLILSFSELLKDRIDQPGASTYAQYIYDAAQRSCELLTEVLASARRTRKSSAEIRIGSGLKPATSVPVTAKKLCILAADDEDILLMMLTEMLNFGGHEILTASNGREAVELYAAHAAKIDVVILDMKMPLMGGDAAFRAMKQINPKLKAILLTGSDMNGEIEALLKEGLIGYLQKPYSAHQLNALLTKASGG